MPKYVWTLEIVVDAEDIDDAHGAVQEELRWSLSKGPIGEASYDIGLLVAEGTFMVQAPRGNIAGLYR